MEQRIIQNSFSSIRASYVEVQEYGRKTRGMSFADLVIWHLTGNFQPRKEVRILIGNPL